MFTGSEVVRLPLYTSDLYCSGSKLQQLEFYTLRQFSSRESQMQSSEQPCPTAEQGRPGSLLQDVLAPFGYSATLHVFAVTLQS